MAGGDLGDEDDGAVICGPLVAEIASIRSPVRQFLGERFTSGLRDLQRRYREAAPPLAVSGVARADADPATVGTAADWLLRFLVRPKPDMHPAVLGVMQCAKSRSTFVPVSACRRSVDDRQPGRWGQPCVNRCSWRSVPATRRQSASVSGDPPST
jgi:hypothetical protein